MLPIDFVCSSKYGEDGEIKSATVETGIPDGANSLGKFHRAVKVA